VKSDALSPVDKYVDLIKDGDAERSGSSGIGIMDGRIPCTHGKSQLDA